MVVWNRLIKCTSYFFNSILSFWDTFTFNDFVLKKPSFFPYFLRSFIKRCFALKMRNVMIVVTVLLSFFMRSLASELLLHLYFISVNSDLGLERSVTGKQRTRTVFLQNRLLTLTCSD